MGRGTPDSFDRIAAEAEDVGPPGPAIPHIGRGDMYLGKIPMRWLERAAALPGKALAAGVALWFEVRCRKSAVVTLPANTRRRFGLTGRRSFRRALRSLQVAGLADVEGRPGSHSRITVLDVPRGETP